MPRMIIFIDPCSFQVQHLLVSMEQYAPQLAALWLIVITQYTTHVRMIYERVRRGYGRGGAITN